VPVLRVNANGGYYGVVTRAPGFATVAKTAAWICRQDQAQLGAQLLRLGAPGGIGGGHMLYIVDLYGPAGQVKGPVPVNVTLTAGDFAPLSDSDGLCAVPVSSP